MDLSAIIPWVPKLAATLLVILGALIALEIRAMLKRKNTPTASPSQPEPVQVTKVRFPDTGVHVETINQASVPTPYKKLFIAVPIIVVLLFVFVTFLSGRINTTPEVVPTPTPVQVAAEIFIYRFGEAGDLELLNYDELKKLEPNTEIIVAVTASSAVQKATFTINGEQVEADTRERTPNGEVFVSYILKPGVVDYYISVALR